MEAVSTSFFRIGCQGNKAERKRKQEGLPKAVFRQFAALRKVLARRRKALFRSDKRIDLLRKANSELQQRMNEYLEERDNCINGLGFLFFFPFGSSTMKTELITCFSFLFFSLIQQRIMLAGQRITIPTDLLTTALKKRKSLPGIFCFGLKLGRTIQWP